MNHKDTKYRYDVQMLIEGVGLDDRKIIKYIHENLRGDCLLVVGDDDLLKNHYHTNEPWDVLQYCKTQGEIFDIVVEDMIRQSNGLKG